MRNLPSEYQEVAYIQSSGTQYIDTGYKGNQDTAFEVKVRMTGTNTQNQQRPGGDMGNTLSNSITVVFPTSSSSVNNRFGGTVVALTSSDISVGTDYVAYTDKNEYSLNGVAKTRTGTVGTFTTENNMWLLQVVNKNYTEGLIGRLYYAKIWDNGILVRDFVPCYRKSDSVIGLYDLVNNQFYTNSGTGTFTKGPDIKGAKIQRIYIGTNQVRPPVPADMEYSYDLVTAGSIAQMQSDGWTFERQSGVTPTSGWQFTTNGLHNTNTGSSNKFGWVKNLGAINCTNAKKITIQVEHYLVSGSWNGASTYRIYLNGVSGSAGGSINSMNNSGYNGYAGASPSTTTWKRVSLGTGNYTGTTILDLENKTAVTSLTGNTDINLTLSDSDVATIRNYTDIQLYYDNVGNYYKSIYVKIEY